MIAAAERFIRVIIRRPHAYSFRDQHPQAPIPGLAFLGPDGKVRGTFTFGGEDDKASLLAKLGEMR